MYNDCVICGNPGQPLNLGGVFFTSLCDVHRGEYDYFIRNSEVGQLNRDINVNLSVLENIGEHRIWTEQEIHNLTELRQVENEVKNKLYQINKKWVEDNAQK